MLTRKQLELLLFINERLKESGIPPSFDEMKDALDLRSKSGIHRLITALEERGFIRRLPNRARALEVLRLPDAVNPSFAAVRQRGFRPNVIEGRLGKAPEPQSRRDEAGERLRRRFPSWAASPPACRSPRSRSTATRSRFRPRCWRAASISRSRCAAISMIDAGILDGDTIILKKQDTANTGDIVVALIDDEEATLKRLRRKGASIALEAANPAYETRIFGPDRVRIQGRLTGLLRKVPSAPAYGLRAFACPRCGARGTFAPRPPRRSAPPLRPPRDSRCRIDHERRPAIGRRAERGDDHVGAPTILRRRPPDRATWLTVTPPDAESRQAVSSQRTPSRRTAPSAGGPPSLSKNCSTT